MSARKMALMKYMFHERGKIYQGILTGDVSASAAVKPVISKFPASTAKLASRDQRPIVGRRDRFVTLYCGCALAMCPYLQRLIWDVPRACRSVHDLDLCTCRMNLVLLTVPPYCLPSLSMIFSISVTTT